MLNVELNGGSARPANSTFNICHSTFNISRFPGRGQKWSWGASGLHFCLLPSAFCLLPAESKPAASATPKIMRPVGLALWLGTGALAFLLARLVPFGRGRRWLGELAAVLLTAFVLGVVATGLDFGGWSEPDPRAGLFTFLGSGAILGILRVATHNLRSEDSR